MVTVIGATGIWFMFGVEFDGSGLAGRIGLPHTGQEEDHRAALDAGLFGPFTLKSPLNPTAPVPD